MLRPMTICAGLLMVLMLGFSGCATVSTYTLDREREDQEMTEGNAGYLYGTPQKPDRSQYRKTRRTYVVEMQTKGPKEEEIEIPRVNTSISVPPSPSRPLPAAVSPVSIPRIEDVSSEEAISNSGVEEYTIEENDTLQKISKKFYGRYSGWKKIYDANADVLKSPDRIVPGTVIKIPQE